MTAQTCFKSLLHTAISPCFPVFPFALNLSYNALHAWLVFRAFIAHMYKTSLSGFPPRLQIFGLPWMLVPLLYSVGLSPAKEINCRWLWVFLNPCVKIMSIAAARLPIPFTLLIFLSCSGCHCCKSSCSFCSKLLTSFFQTILHLFY